MSVESEILLVSHGDDPLRHLVTRILEDHRDRLPDLSRHAVLFPYSGAIPRFRRILREQAEKAGHAALLPPATGTLNTWACKFANAKARRLSANAREILLLGLLNKYPDWQNQYGAWPLIDSLLALLDELTLNQAQLPDDRSQFVRQISGYFGIQSNGSSPFESEAGMVHTVWMAWQERLKNHNLLDQTRQFTDGLARSLHILSEDTRIYLAGFTNFSRSEFQWLKNLHAQRRLTLVLQGQYDPDSGDPDNCIARILQELGVQPVTGVLSDPYSDFLKRAFAAADGNLLARAQEQFAASASSPAGNRLVIHEAADAESEARAIDIQVRRWLGDDIHDIGIVTNDRKLARRVRALLERANVELRDAGGWVLSTTSAATALDRWLECLERNFYHKPLLDLLKSPFLHLDFERSTLDRLVAAFEQGIVRDRNLTSGLDNYRFGISHVRDKLEQRHSSGISSALALLLDRLENAAAELLPLKFTQQQSAVKFIAALQESLKRLGLWDGFENDVAGLELLAVLDEMKTAVGDGHLHLTWAEFHRWLRRNMEQRHFHPPMHGRGVELMGFTESRLYRFEALIIAGALRDHLPGHISAPPYFNDRVRADLGLPALGQRYSLMFHDFRHVLEAAPHVLITLRREHEGERLVASPWVEKLRAFHELAYREKLNNPELEWLVQQPESMIVDHETPLPSPVNQPAARLPAGLVPVAITATDHQRIMDCPYQFFCASGLGLAPEEAVRDEMEKADFGMHVHRILQAFHAGVHGLPGPWEKPLTDDTLAEAAGLLREISRSAFANDLRRHFLARGWLYRWEECIPAYLEWELKYGSHWRIQATEWKQEREYGGTGIRVMLKGRIDRLDRGADGYRLVDYKTGVVPTRQQVQRGEKIQLPFYALLPEEGTVAQALFLSIGDGKVTERNKLEGETLQALKTAVKERILMLKRQLDAESPLPAWGDVETCNICDMEGLCRRGMWNEQIRVNSQTK